MAKTLCRVAGGGKPLKGNAEASDVLAGKTFSNKQSNALTGTMPNKGALNITLTPSGNNSTSQAVAAGYYSGGTITANGSSSYGQGYNDGKWSVKNSGQYVSLNGVRGAADRYTFTFNGRAGYDGVIFQLASANYWIWNGDDGGNSSDFPVSYNSSTGVITIHAYRHTKLVGTIYYY